MASFLVCGGRALFFALLVTQNFMLAAYPATYKDDSTWYAVHAMASSQALSVTIWLGLVLSSVAKLQRLFSTYIYIWGLYILGLVISIAIGLGFVGDILDKKWFLGPNILKTLLCITPLLLLLLFNTAKDGSKEVVSKLCFYMTVDLFDSGEVLDIVLNEKKHNYGIPKGFEAGMIALACISLLLSPWGMAENNLKVKEPRTCTAILRNIAEIAFDVVFLTIRLVIVFKYKKDESIFIAKNGIGIILASFEVHDLLKKG